MEVSFKMFLWSFLCNLIVMVFGVSLCNCIDIFGYDGQGFAIGNGLTQPDIQYEAYADYALDMGLISNSDHFKLGKLYPACAASIKLCGQLLFCSTLICESSNHSFLLCR
jgi:hypothetical protein